MAWASLSRHKEHSPVTLHHSLRLHFLLKSLTFLYFFKVRYVVSLKVVVFGPQDPVALKEEIEKKLNEEKGIVD